MSEDEDDLRQAVASLRQQAKSLASVSGVLLVALRRAGLMQPDLEALLASDLVEAAATQSAPVRGDWELMVSAVRKVAAAAERLPRTP
jgi:hypothetical protein